MMKKTRILSLLLFAAMLLTACQGKPPEVTTQPGQTTTEAQTQTDTTPTATPSDSQTQATTQTQKPTARQTLFAKWNRAIFYYDDTAYRYDGASGEITPFVNQGLKKIGITPSPDGKLLAYQYALADTPDELRVGVLDMQGKPLHEMSHANPICNGDPSLEWISDERFLMEGHINPSTSEYFLFDAKSGTETASFASYRVLPLMGGKTLLYAENVPHGGAAYVQHTLMIDDEIVYTAKEKGELFGDLAASVNSREIAFILEPLDVPDGQDERRKLVIAEYDEKKQTLKQTYETRIPQDADGTLTFDAAGRVCLVQGETQYVLSRKDGSFTAEAVTAKPDAPPPELEKQLRADFAKYLGKSIKGDAFSVGAWILK